MESYLEEDRVCAYFVQSFQYFTMSSSESDVSNANGSYDYESEENYAIEVEGNEEIGAAAAADVDSSTDDDQVMAYSNTIPLLTKSTFEIMKGLFRKVEKKKASYRDVLKALNNWTLGEFLVKDFLPLETAFIQTGIDRHRPK